MKKSVLLIALLLFMTNFVLAEGLCEGRKVPGTDIDVTGVEIGSACFDCGNNEDGICPEDFGADCTYLPDRDCFVGFEDVTAPFWSLDGVNKIPGNYVEIDLVDGKTLYLVAPEVDLADGEEIDFEISEDDGIFGDDYLDTIQGVVKSGKAVASYDIVTLEDVNGEEGSESGLYLLYFKVIGKTIYLEVNLTIGLVKGIETCSEYTTNVSCKDNLGKAGILEGALLEYITGSGCFRQENLVGCKWDSTTSKCGLAPSVIIYSDSNPVDCGGVTSCNYVESENTECGAGDDFFQVHYTTSDPGCEDWTSTAIPCPQELKVPFFGTYAFIVTLSFISLIYVYLVMKKR